MATPNYGYEKRQKELAKRRKKEEKLKARAERKAGAPESGGDAAVDGTGGAEAMPAGLTATPDTATSPGGG